MRRIGGTIQASREHAQVDYIFRKWYSTYMVQVITNALREWNETTDGRSKLQHAYLMASGVLLFVAGILGLINYDLGQKILFVAILAIAMFFINAVAWALLQSFVLLRISATKTTEKITSKTKPRAAARKK